MALRRSFTGQSYETGAWGTSRSALDDAAGAAADPDARHPAGRDEARDHQVVRAYIAADHDQDDDLEREDDDEDGRRELERAEVEAPVPTDEQRDTGGERDHGGDCRGIGEMVR